MVLEKHGYPLLLGILQTLSLSWEIAFCTQDVFMDLLSIFFFVFPFPLKTHDVLYVILLFANF
jgi:hypothetical protein